MNDADAGTPSDARQTLLRALDHLDQIEEEHGPANHVYLAVVYAHQINGRTIRGWATTDDPTFAIVGLLDEISGAINATPVIVEPDGEDEDE